MTLGLTVLYRRVDALTEELRSGNITPAANQLSEQVTGDYQAVVSSIQELLRV